MPTYAYACTVCDHRFDAVQSFSDDALTVCPQCQGRLRKVFNSVGVVFKGSGFYRNDSRSGSTPATGSSDKSDKSEAKSEPSSSKSDSGSKGEAKSESGSTSDSKTSSAKKSGASSASTGSSSKVT